MLKARIFIHLRIVEATWSQYQENGSKIRRQIDEIAWPRLSSLVVERLQHCLPSSNSIDLRGVNVYSSLRPPYCRTPEDERKARWLTTLDHIPGFTVKVLDERQRENGCASCVSDGETSAWLDKGVDTKIACDLLSMAVAKHYDVAVLFSDDEELTPAVETVQDVLDCKVFHLGFKHWGDHLRAACWGHILLDDLVERLSIPAPHRYDTATTSLDTRAA